MLLGWQRAKGFTLIELMVVVAIIALLSAMAIPQFVKLRTKAIRAEAKMAAGNAKKAQSAYFAGADKFFSGCIILGPCVPNPAVVNDILGLGPVLTPHYMHAWSSNSNSGITPNYALILSANLLPPDNGTDWIDQIAVYEGPSISMTIVACQMTLQPEGELIIVEDEITEVDNCAMGG